MKMDCTRGGLHINEWFVFVFVFNIWPIMCRWLICGKWWELSALQLKTCDMMCVFPWILYVYLVIYLSPVLDVALHCICTCVQHLVKGFHDLSARLPDQILSVDCPNPIENNLSQARLSHFVYVYASTLPMPLYVATLAYRNASSRIALARKTSPQQSQRYTTNNMKWHMLSFLICH